MNHTKLNVAKLNLLPKPKLRGLSLILIGGTGDTKPPPSPPKKTQNKTKNFGGKREKLQMLAMHFIPQHCVISIPIRRIARLIDI